MDDDARVLADALREWERFHSPREFVEQVLPIIRAPKSIDWIISQLPPDAHSRVVRELRTEYGAHRALSDEAAWGLGAGTYLDPQARRQRHAEFVAHAVRVAIPAIRAWLAGRINQSDA